MIKTLNKPISFILAVLLILTLLSAAQPMTALAAGETGTTDGWEWVVQSDNTLVITGYSGSEVNLTLPDTLNTGLVDLSVTRIESNAFMDSDIESIVLPDTVITIGDSAFEACRDLISITLPDNAGFTAIPENMFVECKALESLMIPESVISIGANALIGCDALKEIIVDEGNAAFSSEDGVLYNADKTILICHPAGRSGSLDIPNTVTEIGDKAFYNSTHLTSVSIPNGATTIGEEAFLNCLKTVFAEPVLPDSVESIGAHAFSNCKCLTGITIPEGIETIGENTFYNCTALSEIVLPESLAAIGGGAFLSCESLAEITIPENVTNVGNNAFQFCLSLNKVTILNSSSSSPAFGSDIFKYTPLKTVGGDASKGIYGFNNSAAKAYASNNGIPFYIIRAGETGETDGWMWEVLEDETLSITGRTAAVDPLEIPDKLDIDSGPDADEREVTRIGEEAFQWGTWFTEVTIPPSITGIGNKAFQGCSNISDITIPASVENIGDWAFASWGSLENITFGSGSQLETIGEYAFTACLLLDNFDMPDSVTSVGKAAFESCGSLNAITLSDNLDSISEMMFNHCPSLQGITIPNSVESIGFFAFGSNPGSKTGLTSIVIPDSVTSIGQSAFQYCTDLTSAVLPENEYFTEIPSGLFYGCSALNSIDLPQTVTSISGGAFQACGFTSFTIPNTVTSIGRGILSGCTSLSSIILPANSSITRVPEGLVSGCTSLESITIPANMTSIGDSAFAETGFRTFTVPDHVTNIGENAFGECELLTSVTMSANVAGIGDYAFCECPMLIRVTIPGASVTFGKDVFEGSALKGGSLGSEDGIYGLSGSTVETYAQASSIPFHAISNGGSDPGGNGGGGSGSSTKEEPKIKTVVSGNTATVTVPKAAVEPGANGGTDTFQVSTPIASITFGADALSTILDEADEEIIITVSRVDSSSLSAETQQLVGDRPVFEFSVTSGGRTISQFEGNVTVSVPYTLKAGEDPDAIIIYYINSEGELEIVINCRYDPETGTVSFDTDHFSQYVVGYNKVTFKDVPESAWYANAVDFAAARGILTGTGNGNYSPNGKLTRGQLIVMLMRAYGIEPDTNPTDNFSDAGNTYYTGFLAAAKRLGISDGIGNNLFVPDREITRQEMFNLLYNTLNAIGKLPSETGGKPAAEYSDAVSMASWAAEAAGALTSAGVVGGSGGKLLPNSTATRAEIAQVLYNLIAR